MRALLLLTTLMAGCNLIPTQADRRCANLEREVDECLGTTEIPFQCSDLTEQDIDGLAAIISGLGCAGLASLLPLDGDPLAASCAILGESCPPDARPALGSEAATRHPLVLVNGIDVSPLFSWSDRIVEELESGGFDVHLAVVPPYDSTSNRSRVLWSRIQEILKESSAAKVNLLCHSLGGLDCRYVASPGGLHWEVDADHAEILGSLASVTTVATAHHGTPVADIALGLVTNTDSEDAIDALATTLGSWFTGEALADDVQLRSAVAALSESQTLAFNDAVVDAEGLFYQSWGGFSRPFGEAWPHPEDLATACAADEGDGLALFDGAQDHLSLALAQSFDIIAEAEALSEDGLGPNDGLCPVQSSRWGLFRGCIPADHQEQLGRGNIPDTNVRTRIDIAKFYTWVGQDLAQRGF